MATPLVRAASQFKAKQMYVPRSTLQDRLHGKTNQDETRANSHKMTR